MQISWQETRLRLKMDKQRLLSIAKQEGINGFNWPSGSWGVLFHPSYQSVVLHRLSHYCYSNGYRPVARLLWHLNLIITGADITPNTNIAGGLLIKSPMRVTMVGRAGKNLTLEGHGGFGGGRSSEDIGAGPGLPILGDNVSIGYGSMALGPVQIGHNVTIDHRANVSKHIAENSLVKLVQKISVSGVGLEDKKADQLANNSEIIANKFPDPSMLSLRQLISQDVQQYIKYSSAFSGDGTGFLRKLSAVLTPSVSCVILYRLSHKCFNWQIPLLPSLIARVNFLLHRASISPASRIGPGLYIPHTPGVTFHGTAGKNLVLYYHAIVTASETHINKNQLYWDCPRLGDNITIASSATVLGAVQIGDNCVVGMNCTIKESLDVHTSAISRETTKLEQIEQDKTTYVGVESESLNSGLPKISWFETRKRLRIDRQRLSQYYERDGMNAPLYLVFTRSYQAILFYRLAHYFLGRNFKSIARIFWYLNLWFTGADISPRSQIYSGMVIDNPLGINIEANIGKNCTLSEGASVILDRCSPKNELNSKLPIVGDNVRIEAGAIVVGSIEIGSDVTIGSKCCISSSIEDQSLVKTPSLILKRNQQKTT